MIAHQSNWRSKNGGRFQHSFGNGLSSTALNLSSLNSKTVDAVAELEDGSNSDDQTESRVQEIASVGALARNEAELALMAAKGAPGKQLEPLTLFHLRDALMVIIIMSHVVFRGIWH